MDRCELEAMVREILAGCPGVRLVKLPEVSISQSDRLDTKNPADRVYTHDVLTLAESPRLEGKYPVFGRITEGMELLREWAQAELAGTFYPMEPPVPTTKPATPIVMESVTVDTFGVDYPAPVTYPAPIKPPAW